MRAERHRRRQKSKDPIKLTLHDWTGQLITTQIMGEVLKKAGYNVEYVQADYLAQFAGLETGDLHVAMEIWETTGREAMDAAARHRQGREPRRDRHAGQGGVVVSRLHEGEMPRPAELGGAEGPACAEAFSTAETAPKGRYLGGPVTWGGFDEERVEALDLPFEVIHAGTDAALFAELESAYQRKAPIMLWIYAPHWAPAKYEGEWVEFPEYTEPNATPTRPGARTRRDL